MWISAAHTPGKYVIETDHQSRILQDATEWKLHLELLQKIVHKFGKPDINLFASRINRQLKRYVSWHPEPDAMAVNAFSLTWNNKFFYMFPPFSLVDQVLANVIRDKTDAVIVVPDWSNQYWYPQLIQMTTQKPLFSTITKKSDAYTQTLRVPYTTSETSFNGNQGNASTIKILKASLRQSTHCKYSNYIKHWLDYSKTIGKIDVLDSCVRFSKCYV